MKSLIFYLFSLSVDFLPFYIYLYVVLFIYIDNNTFLLNLKLKIIKFFEFILFLVFFNLSILFYFIYLIFFLFFFFFFF